MQNNYTTKANRVLYIVIISVLCLTALIVGIVATVSGRKSSVEVNEPLIEEVPADTVPTPEDIPSGEAEGDNSNIIPTFIAPASGAVSKSHSTDEVVYSSTMNDYRTHTGIDISTTVGAQVYAAADGRILKIWNDEFMGKCISIQHSGDTITVYKNLANELASGIGEGTEVKAGQLIACVGETAELESADEPHLHFEILVKQVSADPLEYISEESKSASFTTDEAYEG